MSLSDTALHDRAQRWEQLFNSISDTSFLFLLSAQGIYLKVKAPDKSRLWMMEDDHLGKSLEEVLPPDLAIDRRYFFDKAVRTRKPQTYGYPHPTTIGRYMACLLTPMSEEPDGEISEVLMEVYDIAAFTRIGRPYVGAASNAHLS